MLLPGIGAEGQQRLDAAHVAIVGMGALGCAAADLLCRAGLRTLTLIDRDIVELSNLHRQTLFTEADATSVTPKAVAAAARLKAINANVVVNSLVEDLTPKNALRLLNISPNQARPPGDLGPPMIILDGTDNFETRYLLNDISVKFNIPLAYAGVVGTGGMQSTFTPGPKNPCLRCIFPEPPAPGSTPTCDTAGVLNTVVAIATALQSTDVIRFITTQQPSPARLTAFDPWLGTHRQLDLSHARNESCPCCALHRFDWLDGAHALRATLLCGQDSIQIAPSAAARAASSPNTQTAPHLESLAARWRTIGKVHLTPHLVRGEFAEPRGPITITVFADGRTVIGNTREVEEARTLHARYVG